MRSSGSARCGAGWVGHAEVSPSFPSKRARSNQPLHLHSEGGVALTGNASFWKRPPAISRSVGQPGAWSLPSCSIPWCPPAMAGAAAPAVRPSPPFPTAPSLSAATRQRSPSRARIVPGVPYGSAWQPASRRSGGHVGRSASGPPAGRWVCLPLPPSQEAARSLPWASRKVRGQRAGLFISLQGSSQQPWQSKSRSTTEL